MDFYFNLSDFTVNKIDHRVSDWLFMSRPLTTLTIVIGYLIFVTLGPKLMVHHQPWNLKGIIIIYNFFLVLLSTYMVYEFVMSSWTVPGFSLLCQPADYSNDPVSVRLAGACWWFFFSKLIELMDTVFFVLRKKNSQISFLHVYHHSTMPILWWIGVRFVAGGEGKDNFTSDCIFNSENTLNQGLFTGFHWPLEEKQLPSIKQERHQLKVCVLVTLYCYYTSILLSTSSFHVDKEYQLHQT
ncbi:Elongation of very long chain fatty acids protein 7 [Bulinus truncatus]|nr:Elongation of very long chain fatty acids protein 7 [Bulinus truncatus]